MYKYKEILPHVLSLINNGPIKTKDIAEELGCTTRTVQRKINILMSDFPIEQDKKNNTWKFADGFSLEKQKLTSKEAALLVLLGCYVKSINNKSINDTFDKFKKRMLDKNPGKENIYYVKNMSSKEYGNTKLSRDLEKYIEDKECISINYEGKNKRIVFLKPVKIVFFNGLWYLIVLGINDTILKYAIDKILEVTGTGKHFELSESKQKRIDKEISMYHDAWSNSGPKTEVLLKVEKEISYYFKGNNNLVPEQKIIKENKDGSLIVSSKISHEKGILFYIYQWIPNITVKSPKWLAENLKKNIEYYLSKL
ncbi:MAG: WYL domain-containing transcriptional regulator [Elusimicrobia bacterium]|nr:WYL domain-containing transcriptional regulator [Elusimicrobiota bacterium]